MCKWCFCFIVRWCLFYCKVMFMFYWQVRDEYRTDYDEGRGGYGKIVATKITQARDPMWRQTKNQGQPICVDHIRSQKCLSGFFLTRAHKSSKFKLISDKSDSIMCTSFIFMVWSMMFLYTWGYIMTDSEICCFITETL